MGFRIFALCLQQLLINWRMALRLSWFWISVIIGVAVVTEIFLSVPAGTQGGFMLVWGLVSFCGFIVCGSIIAIGWHRFILREEYPSSIFVIKHGWPLGSYVWTIVQLVCIAILLAIPAVLLLALFPNLRFVAANFVTFSALSVLLTWMWLRVGLVFPAIAVGDPISFRDSFGLTRPVAGPLLVTSILITVLESVPAILEIVLNSVSGVSWSTILLPISLMFSWVSILVGAGVLTILYGHLYENRPI